MGKSPGFWFFTGDWLKDPELRFCSIFARGLLVDLLCYMFESSERGYLSKPNGEPRTDIEIIDAISGGARDEKLDALAELESSGVLSRDNRGVLYSRRIARLSAISDQRSKAGSKGGSKTQAKLKQPDKQPDKQKQGVSDSDSDSDSVTTDILLTENKKKKEKKKKAVEFTQSFLDWWDVYPVREGKQAAAVAHAKAIKTIAANEGISIEEAGKRLIEKTTGLLDAIEAKRDLVNDYRKQPATWLNQGCYDDEPRAKVDRFASVEKMLSGEIKYDPYADTR